MAPMWRNLEVVGIVLVVMTCRLQTMLVTCRCVEVCPGESANLTCTVTDTTGGFGATVWEGDSSIFDCASGNVQLLHTVAMDTGDCGQLAVGRIVSADGNNFTSVLTVTAPDMSGSLLPVQCTFPKPLPDPPVVVMEYSVTVTGPPTFVPTLTVGEIMRVSGEQWEFNLEWEVPPEHCDLDYVITADPPLPPSDQCTVDCTTQCRVFTLGLDDPHTFTVTAQNCGGTQNGTESDPLQVYLTLPDAPRIVCTLLTYQKSDGDDPGQLAHIALDWTPVPDPVDPAPSVDGSITSYQISVTGMESVITARDVSSYEVDVPEDGSTEYSVSVAAMNVLGLGHTTTVGPYSSSNGLVDVDTNYCKTLSSAEVHCAFPSGQFISDHCTIEYWTASGPHITQTSNRQDNDQVLVLLLEGLQPETLYNYTVSASNDTLQLKVKVEGGFISTETAIESPPTSNANLDGLSEDGRVATYSCDSALYELEGSSSIGYDEENGWPDAPKCYVVGWIVFLIIMVLLLTVVVVIQGAALIYVIVRPRRKQGTVTLNPQRETVEMKENTSYGPVKVQSQTATQEPVYELADTIQLREGVRTAGNVAYGHVGP